MPKVKDGSVPLLVNEAKALEVLRVKRSTLDRYVRTGLLSQERAGKAKLYYMSQLLDLQEVHRRDKFTGLGVHEKTAQLSNRVVLLERRLRMLCEAIGLAHLDYSPTDESLSSLYEIAVAMHGKISGRPNRLFLDRWLSVVPLLTEQEFRRLARLYRHDTDPWKPFYLVNEELTRSVTVFHNLNRDPDMDLYRVRLNLCQARLKMSAMGYMKLEDPRVDPRKLLVEKLESPISPDPTRILDQMIEDLRSSSVDPDQAIQELYEMANALTAKN